SVAHACLVRFRFSFYGSRDRRVPPSFPTRRSSDLLARSAATGCAQARVDSPGRGDDRAHAPGRRQSPGLLYLPLPAAHRHAAHSGQSETVADRPAPGSGASERATSLARQGSGRSVLLGAGYRPDPTGSVALSEALLPAPAAPDSG